MLVNINCVYIYRHALEHEKHIHICVYPTKQQATVVIFPPGDFKVGEGLFSLVQTCLTSEEHLNTPKMSWIRFILCLFRFCHIWFSLTRSSDIYLLSAKGKDSCWPNGRLSILLLMMITETITTIIKTTQTERAITILVLVVTSRVAPSV